MAPALLQLRSTMIYVVVLYYTTIHYTMIYCNALCYNMTQLLHYDILAPDSLQMRASRHGVDTADGVMIRSHVSRGMYVYIYIYIFLFKGSVYKHMCIYIYIYIYV